MIPVREVTLTNQDQSCALVNIVNDEILEIDEAIALSVVAAVEDTAVIVVSTEQGQTVLTVEDDDSRFTIANCLTKYKLGY